MGNGKRKANGQGESNTPSSLLSRSVVSGRPKGLREYAILSNAGVTQVWPTEVTFTPIDAFQREFQLYNKLRKVVWTMKNVFVCIRETHIRIHIT